jgi:4'-phosphopantetheinyl transferase
MNLPANEIHVWRVFLPDVPENQLNKWHTVLSEKERVKAARFHRATDRKSSIVARGALRALLASYTGVSADKLKFSYSENGKPELVLPTDAASVFFNVSHSGDWVLLAFCQGGRVGVDIEKIKSSVDIQSISERYFTAKEAAAVSATADPVTLFFTLWTQKEAYVKACGSTLFRELRKKIDLTVWKLFSLEIDSHYAAALVSDSPDIKVIHRTVETILK